MKFLLILLCLLTITLKVKKYNYGYDFMILYIGPTCGKRRSKIYIFQPELPHLDFATDKCHWIDLHICWEKRPPLNVHIVAYQKMSTIFWWNTVVTCQVKYSIVRKTRVWQTWHLRTPNSFTDRFSDMVRKKLLSSRSLSVII